MREEKLMKTSLAVQMSSLIRRDWPTIKSVKAIKCDQIHPASLFKRDRKNALEEVFLLLANCRAKLELKCLQTCGLMPSRKTN